MLNNTTQLLNYRISGIGDPVLFLHGFMEDLSMWNNIISELPIRAIVVDLPGHGESAELNGIPSIEQMARKVMEIVQLENFSNAQIIGHSLGGYVGLELMKLSPDFEHLTLFHSHPWEDSSAKKGDRNRVIELIDDKLSFFIREAIPNLFWNKTLSQSIQNYIEVAKKMNPSAIKYATMAMRDREDNTNIMFSDKEKFTLVQGEFDALIPKSATHEFCQMNGINYIEIKSSGHMAHEEQTEETIKLFKTILLKN